MPTPPALPVTGDPEADALLETDPLALLIGMVLDQQVPMERAFHSPYDLKQRLGGELDAAVIAEMDEGRFGELFSQKPALHRFPGSMAKRVQAVCQALIEGYDGKADNVWKSAKTGKELFVRLRELPGFGPEKSHIFVALLAKRFDVKPEGWEEYAADWASVADIDSPESLDRVREAKRAMKAAKAAKKSGA